MAATVGTSRDLRRFVKFGRKIVAVGRNYRYGKRYLKLKRRTSKVQGSVYLFHSSENTLQS